jgi:hypothetical protein
MGTESASGGPLFLATKKMVSWPTEAENCREDLLIFAQLTLFCSIKQSYRANLHYRKKGRKSIFYED